MSTQTQAKTKQGVKWDGRIESLKHHPEGKGLLHYVRKSNTALMESIVYGKATTGLCGTQILLDPDLTVSETDGMDAKSTGQGMAICRECLDARLTEGA